MARVILRAIWGRVRPEVQRWVVNRALHIPTDRLKGPKGLALLSKSLGLETPLTEADWRQIEGFAQLWALTQVDALVEEV